jgi:hypothetical protein
MEFYSAIRKNKIMLFVGKWMELEDIMLTEISQVQKDKGLMFSCHMWKIDTKDKCVHKNKHDHIYIYMQNMFVIVEPGEEGKKKRMKESQQY